MRSVQKPSRYAGGEWNAVVKDWEKTEVKMAFGFPDVYEVGMSHLGLQILYSLVNSREDALMERVFAPWGDMEEQLRQHNLPLFSLESRRPLGEFDILAFTLQYEMSFTNILNMLDLSGMPLRSGHRDDSHPLILAGGPCAFNPEPLADFIDAFVLGEGEEVLNDIIDMFKKSRGYSKSDLLGRLARVPGVYVPSLYDVSYMQDGSMEKVTPLLPDIPGVVIKRVVKDMDQAHFPQKPIVPHLEVVHDRIMLEVLRGCTRGCRFCQAGAIYRPVREKSPATLALQASNLVGSTGHNEISLTSLSTADYSGVRPLVTELLDNLGEMGVSISLPSLRVDAFSVDLAKQVQRVRRSSLTFAPEAGTQRLRDVINKGVTAQNLVEAVTAAFKSGWQAVKLYFMIGLPTEGDEDLDGIVELARTVLDCGLKSGVSRGRLKVTVSVSSFVPKSHTAFQWEPFDRMEELRRKQLYLKDKLKHKNISFNWHEPAVSFLEAVFARGDRRLGGALERAFALGARFDGWSECFKFQIWQQAFNEAGIDPYWYGHRRFNAEDTLPWDHIGAGVDKGFLVREHKKALEGQLTGDCRSGRCPACGLCASLEIEPVLFGGDSVVPL